MSFSSPPTSRDCFVIGMPAPSWNPKFGFGIIKRGEKNWGFYGSIESKKYAGYSHLVLCGNRCYAIGSGFKILVFDLKRMSMNFLDNPLHKDSSFMYNIKMGYLVEHGAKLLAVLVPYEEQNIYIRGMNPTKQEWLPVETLRNKMLFVSKTSSMLKSAPVEAASNKIYFPKILNDVTFIPYCLATRKYVSFLDEYASGCPWSADINVKQWTKCTWIETMPFVHASAACNQQNNW